MTGPNDVRQMMMRALMRPTGAALIAMLLGTTALRADVTAEEVWQSIADYYAGVGATVTTGSKEMAGDTLVIRGAEIAAGDGGARLNLRVPELRLRETGAGTVEVTAAEKIAGSVEGPRGTGPAAATGFEITQTGLTVIVSGSAGDMTYDYEAPSLSVATIGPQAAGQAVAPSLTLAIADGSGKTRMAGTTTRVIDSDAGARTMTFEVTQPGTPDAPEAMTTTGTLSDLRMVSGAQVPVGIDLNDMGKAIAAGYRLDGRVQFASGNINADVSDASGTTNVQAGLADGLLTLSMSQAGVQTAVSTGASRAVVQVPSLPVPAEVGVDGIAMTLALPDGADGKAGPFTLVQRLSGLTLSDGIWAMFDPTAALPRDPMSFAFDLSGTTKFARGLYADRSPGAADTIPAEIETLTLNELKLSALGADIAGSGAARIDNGGAQPRPIGAADFEIKGLNGLFDRLVAMNLVPQDQAMGLRMMMAMFTVPTGEDSARSRIEADEAGDVRVNGQVLYKFPKP